MQDIVIYDHRVWIRLASAKLGGGHHSSVDLSVPTIQYSKKYTGNLKFADDWIRTVYTFGVGSDCSTN